MERDLGWGGVRSGWSGEGVVVGVGGVVGVGVLILLISLLLSFGEDGR